MNIRDKKKLVQIRSKSTIIEPQQPEPPEAPDKAASVDSMEHGQRPASQHHVDPSSRPNPRRPNVPPPDSATSVTSLLATRAQLPPEALENLTPRSANMKRVNRSHKGFLVAFPLNAKQVNLKRLQDEERFLLRLREAGLPAPRVYSTPEGHFEVPLSELNGEPALITDWVEGYAADFWKIRGQLATTVRQFFHEVPGAHRAQRGQALQDSLGAIMNYFEKRNCIVDLQVIIEQSTGVAKIIDPAQIYNGTIPFKHRRRHREVLKELRMGQTLIETLLKEKPQETPPIDKWSKTDLESFWEIECASLDHPFLEGIWAKLSAGPKRAETFGDLMERSEVLERTQWQKFAEEKEKKP